MLFILKKSKRNNNKFYIYIYLRNVKNIIKLKEKEILFQKKIKYINAITNGSVSISNG